MRAPSDPTSDVGKPTLRVPMSKLSFTSWPKLSIAGEGEVTLKRRIDQKLASVKCTLIYVTDMWLFCTPGEKLVKQQSREDLQMSLPSERRPALEKQCTYSDLHCFLNNCLLSLPPLLYSYCLRVLITFYGFHHCTSTQIIL